MIHKRSFVVSLAVLWLTTAALAHVFWVQPMRYGVAVGDIVKVQLHVGDTFPGDIVPRDDEKIEKFVVEGPSGEKPAMGRDADSIAAVFRPTQPGTYLIAYRSKPSPVTLEADKFEAYLRDKGLEKIIELRANAGQSSLPGREVFSRSAKAAIRVGDQRSDEVATKDLGFRVEIVPKSNPASLKPGDALALSVMSEGKPLAGALVQARNVEHPGARLVDRADNKGQLSFTLAHAGVWVIDTVDMFAAPKDSGADWESVWASLSFEIRLPADSGKNKP